MPFWGTQYMVMLFLLIFAIKNEFLSMIDRINNASVIGEQQADSSLQIMDALNELTMSAEKINKVSQIL